MRLLILAILLLFSTPRAMALSNVFFSKDGKTATVLLAGMPGDRDPAAFYDALKITPEDFQGKWSKKLSLAGADGAKAFDVACVFSKMIVNSGSCTLTFRLSKGLIDVSKEQGRARLTLKGEAAARFAVLFAVPPESPLIFRSQDGRLNFSAIRDQGVVTEFTGDWNGRVR